ncbi:pantoate--beta-alanine ligase [Dysgonomonas hofstadii]|uniref:Pantothenate synthetase n=1 Tax=Dysgonomonas hofstadii TaxID=637886 RepID=A0A840CM77_9BACT|nr:pantoate--beta-alanine ligase [Dysgonomonas hofstadii]MBB4034604.1 pantoate--beta-alanine ligase [Dysgonomonas hofstadii]
MRIVKTTKELGNLLETLRSERKSIGLVPTMGALHQGHLSLVGKCVADNDVCVVSIFVNPTQFNNKEDLEKYPRTLERDGQLLEKAGVDIIFAPSEAEIYPEPDTRRFDFGQLDKVMEGVHRPGHFNGVAQVVSRLFDIVKPVRAYFGEKDFQQLAIIREMVKQLNLPAQIIPMPIIREPSGLAMSSRNERLSQEQRNIAVNISRILFESKEWMKNIPVKETAGKVVNSINSIKELDVEYYEIVDGYTLQPVAGWKDSNYIVGCIAVFCGDVRLIDNIVYKAES